MIWQRAVRKGLINFICDYLNIVKNS